jgi:hypothetical protein
MRATFQNSGMVLSIGIFFSLMIVGLAASLPSTLHSGLVDAGVPSASARAVSHIPPVATLFAAFLGYNPLKTLLGKKTLSTMTAANRAKVTGKSFFPRLISKPFMHGLRITFTASLVMCLIAAAASWSRGGKYVHDEDGVGAFGSAEHPGASGDEAPQTEEWTPA